MHTCMMYITAERSSPVELGNVLSKIAAGSTSAGSISAGFLFRDLQCPDGLCGSPSFFFRDPLCQDGLFGPPSFCGTCLIFGACLCRSRSATPSDP